MSTAAVRLCRAVRQTGMAGPWDQVPGLGLVLATGPDCVDFLQARLTSDVAALAPGQGQLSAKLTPRGELVAYFSLHRLPDQGRPFPAFFLLAPRPDLEVLLEDLAATIISEDVILEDAGSQFTGCLLQGPATDACLENLGCPPGPEAQEFAVTLPPGGGPALPADLMILTRSFTGDPGRLLLWRAGNDGDWLGDCLAAATRAGLTWFKEDPEHDLAWGWLTAEAGWPVMGRDFQTGKRLLPATGLEQQVASATKGCYPGQEVVARIRTYGSVPAALRTLLLDGDDPEDLADLPAPGEDLLAAGKKIGSWATAAWSVTRDRPLALVYLDREHRTPGAKFPVTAGSRERTAEVVLPQVHRAADRRELGRQLYDRALRSFGSGQDEEAVSLLERVISLDPDLHDAYEALGVILGRGERYVEAIDVFRRLEEVAPHEPMVHTNLSLFYMKIGDRDEAERQKAQATLKKFAAAADPQEAAAMQEAAETAARQDAARRVGMFEEVLAMDPEDPLALMGLGKALADLEDQEAAEPYLAKALTAQPDNSALYAARGKNLEALGRAEQACEVYRQGMAVASRRGDLMPLKDMEHRLLLLEG